VYPDSGSAYVDGVSGVGAFINTTCSNDLIINLNSSTRKVGFSLQNAVSTNSATPAFTSTPFLAQGAYLVVGNLMYNYAANLWYQFTTVAAFGFTPPGGSNNKQDQLTFVNPQANVHVNQGENQPLMNSLIVVTHSPANAATGAVETWTITPDNTNMNPSGTPIATQVGTLELPSAHGNINAGEFMAPFQFIVTRK